VAAAAPQIEYQLAKPAVFKVFYTPWDESRDEYNKRIQRYAYFLAAAQELYALNNAASAIGGKKAGESTLLSSISAMASSVADVDVASEEKSPAKEIHFVVLPGLDLPPQAGPELKTVSTISRNLRALSVAAAERAASSSSKRSISAPLTMSPGLNSPAWDGRGDSESTIANRILIALRNLALRDGETQSAFNEAKERLMEAEALKTRKVENVVVLIKQEEERPPMPPPQMRRTFDADLALVSKRSALIRAATTATNAAVLAAETVTGGTSSTRNRSTLVSETLPISRSQGPAATATSSTSDSAVVGIASLADVGPIGLRDSLIQSKRGFRGSMNGTGFQRSVGPAQLMSLVVPSPHAHAAYKRLLREATVTRSDPPIPSNTSVRIDSPVKKSLINAVRPSSASGRIAVNGGASAGEVIALLQQSRVARSAALFGL
jgi:hypothetical protein